MAKAPWGDTALDATEYGPACWQTAGNHDAEQVPPGQKVGIEEFGEGMVKQMGFPPEAAAKMLEAMSDAPPVPQSEDALTLTVTTPDAAGSFPVMCWIHGGDHQDGTGEDELDHNNSLSALGVVKVTIQYRLGIFGYFSHPELPHTNVGSLDQIMALEWIKDNIAAFGGDAGTNCKRNAIFPRNLLFNTQTEYGITPDK